jgi:cytosine permease
VVGILDKIPGVPAAWVKADNPEVLFSFIAGFVVYFLLAKAGLRPPVVSLEVLSTSAA